MNLTDKAPLLALALLFAGSGPAAFAAPTATSAPADNPMVSADGEAGSSPSVPEDADARRVRERSPAGLSEAYFACLADTHYNATESASCVSAEIEKQDARLNRLYGSLMKQLDDAGKTELRNAQRAWIQLSSHDAGLEVSIYGDEAIGNAQSHENALFRICNRANVLQKYLDFVEI